MVADRGRVSAPLADLEAVPGWELVSKGVADLQVGRSTIEAALVRSAAPRLRALGLPVADGAAELTDSSLYDLVVSEVGPARAHGRYNALRRRLASFLRAAPHARSG
jgi:hypothetical protein